VCRKESVRVQDFEKLGTFYLGRTVDPTSGAKGDLLLYDSRDLVTHAVCVGMTGSGKTGLCIGLLEEAALDGIPALVIDPKGDLANLLLTFPELRPEDFEPWVQPEEAARQGVTVPDLARAQATLWRDGLREWGQEASRIQALRSAADFAVYTPGSSAGLQVSILDSFASPPEAIRRDDDLRRERIGTVVTSLLELLGLDADPVQSRDHILLSTLLESAWLQGQALDLAGLIRLLQEPPMTRIGVVDIESFYPRKDRFATAMRLNNLLAAPGFQSWLAGEPMDVQRLLYTREGKPRIAIFSIAHLQDPERMFFVSLLLNQALGWMRSQSGTGSLRAILYMDEIAGYLPPTANPPSKAPLLTLLKQARAFGFGVVLSTQNPVDLDYKALSNAGTWFIGRLQTEQDKARLLDGLESVRPDGALSRRAMEDLIAGLGKRVFLLHNVHDDAPVLFQTRWAMSYLRGPMTRDEIRRLAAAQPAGAARPAAPAGRSHPPAPAGVDVAPRAAAPPIAAPAEKPLLPPDVPECALACTTPQPSGATLEYRPGLCGSARIDYRSQRPVIDARHDVVLVVEPVTDRLSWDDAREQASGQPLLDAPQPARFKDLPPLLASPRTYTDGNRSLLDWLVRNRPLSLWRDAVLGVVSQPGESEGDFRVRLRDLARQERDRRAETLRQKFGPRFDRLRDTVRRLEQAVAREQDQLQSVKTQTVISMGAAVLGSFLGRKRVSVGTLGRTTTAARGVDRSRKEAMDVDRAKDNLTAAQAKLQELEQEFQADVAALESNAAASGLEAFSVRPKKSDVVVQRVALVWVPYWIHPDGRAERAC
jgi:hypothetical protein